METVANCDPQLAEVFAITNYFGQAVAAEIYDSYPFGANPEVWSEALYHSSYIAALQDIENKFLLWQKNAQLAERFGLPLVAYEGGQHLTPSGYGNWDNPAHADFMTFLENFQYSPQMESLYTKALDLWTLAGGSTASQLVDIGPYSYYGYWGAARYVSESTENSPKWRALSTWSHKRETELEGMRK